MTVFEHLLSTYRAAEKAHPDLMEPYSQALEDAEDRDAMAAVMRRALRETIAQRFPLPEAHSVGAEPERQGAFGL